MRKYNFRSIRVKKLKENHIKSGIPDYSNIICLNGVYFTLVGWLDATTSNISYVLEEVTQDRLDKDKYLRSAFVKELEKNKKQ